METLLGQFAEERFVGVGVGIKKIQAEVKTTLVNLVKVKKTLWVSKLLELKAETRCSF